MKKNNHKTKTRTEPNRESDALKQEQAREEFKRKIFLKSIELYRAIEDRSLLTKVDKDIIDFIEVKLAQS